MARPLKTGLDYFPLDVNLDEKMELIEAKHGLIGFGVIIKLFQKIYKEGYYLKWNEEAALLFSNRINVNINAVNVIINDALKYGIFSQEQFANHQILTSSGIQKRYLSAVDRRKMVNLVKKYVIADINAINVNINWINDDNSTQSKVKNIYNNNRGINVNNNSINVNKNSEEKNNDSIDYNFFIENYHHLCPKLRKIVALNNQRKGFLRARLGEFGQEKVIQAFRMAGESDFLNGKNDRAWKADFEWILRPSNFLKILEGKYLNPVSNQENKQRKILTYETI